MSNRASLELTLGTPTGGRRKQPDEPFRILFLTDLSGQDSADPTFTPHRVSYESFTATIRSLAPQATVNIDTPIPINETITIGDIDDFHPDALARSLSVFRTLRILGDRLNDPATRDEALTQIGELTGPSTAATPMQEPLPDQESQGEDDGDMMERLLGASAGASSHTRAQEKVESFIQNVMGDAQVEIPSVAAEVGQQHIDALRAATMRAVLLSQPLRSLERAWRSVAWLIQRLDNEAVEIHVVDLPKAGLSAHLAKHVDRLDESKLHQLFCEPPSGDSWDAFVADYSFALDANDLVMLTTLGAIAGQAGAPVLAHGEMNLCGCQSLEHLDTPHDWQLPEDELGELWSQVRAHPASRWVGLATPRIVLRQPYGPHSDPIDAFDFHELPPNPEHERFVWGNPAIGCAYLLGRAHTEELDFTGAGDLDIEDLPTVLYDDGTGQALQPPVEALMSERAMNQIQSAGLIPMLGKRGANSVHCAGLDAIALQATRLTR
jgi:type VI secretion system protein ImpC